MDARDARSALRGRRFARLEWVAETGSTNADLLAVARSGADVPVDEQVLVADHQLAGRGRLGRVWEAPVGASLLCSILVRPGLDIARVHLVTQALGIAAAEACAEVAGVEVGLKWPNDLVVDGGDRDLKVAGILAESVVRGSRVDVVVAGIGINVNWPDLVPAELAGIATSLRHRCGHDVDRGELLVALLERFESTLAATTSDAGVAGLADRYRARSATIGREVSVERPGGDLQGRAVDVTEEGHLVVETPDGPETVAVGDIVHLRHRRAQP